MQDDQMHAGQSDACRMIRCMQDDQIQQDNPAEEMHAG